MSEIKVDTISERTASAGVTVDGVIIKDNAVTTPSGIVTDTLSERTAASGVTVDGVIMKDNSVTTPSGIITDTLSERTTASGVTVDGVIMKDNTVETPSGIITDTISERTAASGVTLDGVLLKDSGLTIPSGGTLTVASGGATSIDAVINATSFVGLGAILQFGYASKTSIYSRTGSGWAAVTGLSVSLTKSTLTSTFIVIVTLSGNSSGASSGGAGIGRVIDGGSFTVPDIGDADGSRTRIQSFMTTLAKPAGMTMVHSPSTTGVCTYSAATYGVLSTDTQYVNRDQTDTDSVTIARCSSYIVVIEVG